MLLAIQIALGIWMGGLFLAATATVYFTAATKIERNKHYGYPWYRGLFWRAA